MRKHLIINTLAAIICIGAGPVASAAQGDQAAAGEIDRKELGYFYGYNFGNMMKQQTEVAVDLDELLKGIRDALAGSDSVLTPERQQALIAMIQREQQSRQQQMLRASESDAKNWLAQNAGRDGIQVTGSGLQYQVLTAAEGGHPTPDDRVSVHYRGQTVDGREFDSSYKRGEPASFGLNQVIDGWTEGLQLMSPGAKYRFFIPPQLAYGAGGVPRAGIPPNAVLIFEVELLAINPTE